MRMRIGAIFSEICEVGWTPFAKVVRGLGSINDQEASVCEPCYGDGDPVVEGCWPDGVWVGGGRLGTSLFVQTTPVEHRWSGRTARHR